MPRRRSNSAPMPLGVGCGARTQWQQRQHAQHSWRWHRALLRCMGRSRHLQRGRPASAAWTASGSCGPFAPWTPPNPNPSPSSSWNPHPVGRGELRLVLVLWRVRQGTAARAPRAGRGGARRVVGRQLRGGRRVVGLDRRLKRLLCACARDAIRAGVKACCRPLVRCGPAAAVNRHAMQGRIRTHHTNCQVQLVGREPTRSAPSALPLSSRAPPPRPWEPPRQGRCAAATTCRRAPTARPSARAARAHHDDLEAGQRVVAQHRRVPHQRVERVPHRALHVEELGVRVCGPAGGTRERTRRVTTSGPQHHTCALHVEELGVRVCGQVGSMRVHGTSPLGQQHHTCALHAENWASAGQARPSQCAKVRAVPTPTSPPAAGQASRSCPAACPPAGQGLVSPQRCRARLRRTPSMPLAGGGQVVEHSGWESHTPQALTLHLVLLARHGVLCLLELQLPLVPRAAQRGPYALQLACASATARGSKGAPATAKVGAAFGDHTRCSLPAPQAPHTHRGVRPPRAAPQHPCPVPARPRTAAWPTPGAYWCGAAPALRKASPCAAPTARWPGWALGAAPLPRSAAHPGGC